MCMGSRKDRKDRGDVRRWARNMRKPMPPGRKLKYITRNLWLRTIKLQACCGHPGEPGC